MNGRPGFAFLEELEVPGVVTDAPGLHARLELEGNADFAGVSTRDGRVFVTLRARGAEAVVARERLTKVVRAAPTTPIGAGERRTLL